MGMAGGTNTGLEYFAIVVGSSEPPASGAPRALGPAEGRQQQRSDPGCRADFQKTAAANSRLVEKRASLSHGRLP
jgi:hypothetical protein